jgi:hypothetical protein
LDLKSGEAPIRARAVVLLRHLACAVDDPAPRTAAGSGRKEGDYGDRALDLLLDALRDPESYVYLAAIQTIAMMADERPKQMLPFLAAAVATGELPRAAGGAPSSPAAAAAAAVALSPEQRVKLAEALASCLRRRAAVCEHAPAMLDALLVARGPGAGDGGAPARGAPPPTRDLGLLVHEATRRYFRGGDPAPGPGGRSSEPPVLNGPEDEFRDEMGTRARTGGPLFDAEEADVVRAAKLSVAAELVAAASSSSASDCPGALARHCHLLVGGCLDALRLDASRPVRRSGALLARELYAAVLREHERLDSPARGAGSWGGPIPLTIALVEAGEEALAAALERCLGLDDLDDLGDDRPRFADPAAAARCREALSVRSEAEDGGMLAAGRLLVREGSGRRHVAPLLLEPSRSAAQRQRAASKALRSSLIAEIG